MSNEISQEAKTSIAQLNQRKARERLERDGAHSSDALRRRVRAIAQERNLPPADIAKLMYKRINTRDVMLFCEKHKVSCDWLLCGDLQGLRRMTRDEIAFRPVLLASSTSGFDPYRPSAKKRRTQTVPTPLDPVFVGHFSVDDGLI